MVGGIREKRGGGFGEEGLFATVSFGQDDLVEEFDTRILGTSGLALVYKFVEGLGLAE